MNAPFKPGAQDAIARAALQAQVVQALGRDLPQHALLYQTEDTAPYECDGLTAYRQRPLVVALPETEAQVQAVLRSCHALGVPWWRVVRVPVCLAAPCPMRKA
jgi:glycolate oxidase